MHALHTLTIQRFGEGLRKKDFSALDIAQAYLERIEDRDRDIHAYLSVDAHHALQKAERVDLALARGEALPPLAGVPLALKDNILVRGKPATAGSKILERYTASYDACVVQKLKAQHAVILGKTNLDEFAMGSSTENSAFGPTRNPHDESRVPGGSSGGSTAAVAAHLALGALGSDTGGSVRQPAAFCGVVGLKPTYGAVSRSGLIALASSLDQIGPIAKTVKDAAIIFGAIAGADPMDATSAHPPEGSYGKTLTEPDFAAIKSLTVGIPQEYFVRGLDPQVEEAVESAIDALKSLGVKFKSVSLPHTRYALSAYYIILPAEASANLARFDGVRYARRPEAENPPSLRDLYFKNRGAGFGPEPTRRIILGTFVLSSGYYDAYYEKAQRVRALIVQDFMNVFREADVLLTPVTPTPPFKLGEKTSDPLSMYLSDIFTIPANLAGVPAISIPVAKNPLPETPLPVGFQLIGRRFREADILGLGQYYEEITAAS
jgi:aspartyl-tRNA(Asn)/glutamyl-tRNA(Gln) amidotransferase subunit A